MDATLAGLVQGCAEALEDNAPRLILADWLEDHGQSELAELDLDADALVTLLDSPHLEHLVDLDLTGNRWPGTGSPALAGLTRLALRHPPALESVTGLLDRAGPRLRELDVGGALLPPEV